MGDGNPRIGRSGDTSRDTRHHLNRDVMFGQISRFLSTAAEEKGIASFEANHTPMFLGHCDQHSVGAGLGNGMVSPALTDELALTRGRDQIKHLFGDKGVVHQCIALLKETMRLDREQFRVSGACTHEVNGSWLRLSHGSAAKRSMKP